MMPESPARKLRLAPTVGLYALGFAVLAWPWLSGSVTIPWDAKSQSFPNLAFLARSLAQGQSPFWTPHIYAGWPQIADPQSLIFSPFHFLLALLDATPSFRAADAVVFALLFVGGLGIILIFRERGWHEGGALVAALAFAFGGSNASRLQHIGLLESAAWLPLALFLLMRALDRGAQSGSWRWGIAAGLAAGLIAIGRDQVALLGLYLLAGFVLWHWLEGQGVRARIVASLRPLMAGGAAGAVVIAVPLLLTALLAASSNRPEIGYDITVRGSLHPADLLMLVFADLFGAADPKVAYWGPPSFAWHEAFGSTDLYHAQNIGQLYAGALVIVAVVGFGLIRGLLWAREIRFFAVALALTLLYALGKYTPAFQAMYEVLPGVSLYRRPADATFVVGMLLAICAGYCVHRWLMGTAPESTWRQRATEIVIAGFAIGTAGALAVKVGMAIQVINPIIVATVTLLAAVGALRLAYRLAATNALAAAAVLAAFSTADLAWNNAPHEFERLAAIVLRRAACRHQERDRRAAQGEACRQFGTGTARPRRADRHRLPLAKHRRGARLRPSIRSQPAAARRVRTRHKRGRHRGGARPAPVLGAASLLQFPPRKPVRCALHRDRRAGRRDRQVAQARRFDIHCTHQGHLRL